MDHLRLLSIFHYVVGAIVGLMSLFPLIHIIIGVVILNGGLDDGSGDAPPSFIGWLFILLPAFFILAGLTLASCIAIAGRMLSVRDRYYYCLVMAGVECLIMPFGTVLGVFTLIVLQRHTVKEMFGISGNAGNSE
ncbi:MAG: hypothetical protein AAGA30_18050 [Planctomycetota bacterium]